MRSYKGLVNRYIKNEKRSIVPIFISIILTISLITSVVFIAQNIMENDFIEKKILFGDYDIRLQKINNERLNIIKNHENVKEYALGKNKEILVNKSKKDDSLNYISIYGVEKKVLDEYINLKVIEGRLPQNENEIVLNKEMLSLLSKEYKVGSVIEAKIRELRGENIYLDSMARLYNDIGSEMYGDVDELDKSIQNIVDKDIKVEDDKKVSYTIVGIIETDIADKLFGDKLVRLLSKEEMSNTSEEFEVFTYLNNPSKEEELTKELGLKYILPNSSMVDPFGYPAADVKYVGYDKGEYTSLLRNPLARNILLIIIAFCFMAVYNTFHASVAKRIKTYGILRALGGNMRQISYLIYMEALILFIVAAPIGLTIGYILTKVESYILINSLGILEQFKMDFNLDIILIVLVSVFLIILIAVKSVLRKEGKLTPIEAIIDARGLTRNKKSLGSNFLGQSFIETGSGEEDEKAIKELLDYDKKTFKFKIMRKLFRFEGELAHKNITRDEKAHKLTKVTLFMAMAILIFFLLQVINGSVNSKDIIKSNKWDIKVSLDSQQFSSSAIDEIKSVSGVENVYRTSEAKITIDADEKFIGKELKDVLATKPSKDDKEKTREIISSIMTLDEESIKLYDGINKDLLDNGGVILVNKATNYIEKKYMEGGDLVQYMYLNSNEVLNYKTSDRLIIAGEDNSSELKALNIVGTVDDDILNSTFNSTNRFELDYNFKLLTTEEGFAKIFGGLSNSKILIKTTNNENRKDTISELRRISANNNYEIEDVIGSKLEFERNIREDLGLNIIFGVTIVIMVILNLINTSNASILSRRKELAAMRAMGMSNSQEKKMIIGELFYIALTVSITVILTVGTLSIATQGANIGSGKVNVTTLLIGEGLIILFLMVISNLTALAPLAQAKKFSIVEDLKEE
ncbi:MAG: ABC transporter permease [Clostridium sp.]